MKNIISNSKITGVMITIFVVLIVFLFSFSKPEKTDNLNHVYKNYNIYMLTLPQNINFAGEQVPLENFDTKESLDREIHVNTYWHSQTLLFFKRANRYFPTIEKILKENNIPDDFKYLALIESGLTNVVSPAGATGFWQFLESTANEYGLEVNEQIDERYNIEKSTEAACRYFNKSYKKFRNWTMVAASYNMGRRNLIKQIARQQTNNYYDLLLGDETERYIFRLLAVKYIFKKPENYGFNIDKKELYWPIPYYIVTIDSTVDNFTDFAYSYSTNYKMLKYMNPWLRDNFLKNENRNEYWLKIPKTGFRQVNLENRLSKDSILYFTD
ncbi:MAG: lytic transglycosylase domain-containing protein [Chlorobi bacterium]|nr:lytic transglycosylase domain-containing protein [Chlorobiota bacterium]